MATLTSIFGYTWAIIFKDSFGNLVIGIFGALVTVWLAVDFYLNVDLPTKEEDAVPALSAIVRAGNGKDAKYYAVPKTHIEAIEVFFSYFYIKMFPKNRTLTYKNAKVLVTILSLIMLLVLAIGVLLAMWVYIPNP